jgi:ABC-2 type transport system ATP-binding protein
MLQIEEFKKSYAGTPVLEITALRLEPGIYRVAGSNGSGKSTLLRCVAGMLPFTGHISINGTGIQRNPVAYRRLVSYAPAEPVYPAFITGNELISFYSSLRKVPQKQAAVYAEALQVGTWLANPVSSYSSGMLKKLSLVLALTGHAPWILLDEPLTTLDVAAVRQLSQLVGGMHQEKGVAFIIASHQDVPDNMIPFTGGFLVREGAVIPAAHA